MAENGNVAVIDSRVSTRDKDKNADK